MKKAPKLEINNIMITHFKYKGYQGTVETEQVKGKLYGKLALIRDVVTYEANTLKELEKEFRFSVDEYLSDCEKLCKTPDRNKFKKLPL